MQFGILTRRILVIHLNLIGNFAKKNSGLYTKCMTWNFSHKIADQIQVYGQEVI